MRSRETAAWVPWGPRGNRRNAGGFPWGEFLAAAAALAAREPAGRIMRSRSGRGAVTRDGVLGAPAGCGGRTARRPPGPDRQARRRPGRDVHRHGARGPQADRRGVPPCSRGGRLGGRVKSGHLWTPRSAATSCCGGGFTRRGCAKRSPGPVLPPPRRSGEVLDEMEAIGGGDRPGDAAGARSGRL